MRIGTVRHFFGVVGVFLAGLMIAGPITANTDLTGIAGVDLHYMSFDNNIKDGSGESFSVNRSQSAHYLTIGLAGPIVSQNFANYALSGRFIGRYVKSLSASKKDNVYLTPSLGEYGASLTLFPDRRYPLRLFKNHSTNYSIRYESGNRSQLSTVQPSLLILRRYMAKTDSRGGMMRWDASEKLSFESMYSEEDSEAERVYDFGEDRDIWVEVEQDPLAYLSETDTIRLINDITDADIRVLIGVDIDVTVPATDTFVIVVDSGFHNVEVIPLTDYNQYRFGVTVGANQDWRIIHAVPLGAQDLLQSSSSTNIGMNYTSDKITDGATYSRSESNSPTTGVSSVATNLANFAEIELSQKASLLLNTTIASNEATTVGAGSNLSNSLAHTSTVTHGRSRGTHVTFSHGFDKSSTESGGTLSETQLNTFIGEYSRPSRKLNHKLDIKAIGSFQSDSKNQSIKQYMADVTNRIALSWLNFDLKPENQTKYTISQQVVPDTPDKTLKTLESRFSINGRRDHLGPLEAVIVSGELDYRKVSESIRTDVTKKYKLSFGFARAFGSRWRLGFSTNQRWETFGGTISTPGVSGTQKAPSKPSKHTSGYNFSLGAQPFGDALVTVTYNLTPSSNSKIQKISALVKWTLPLINAPLEHKFSKELRDLSALPTQSQTDMETKIRFKYRQIILSFVHKFAQEDLLANTFDYHEIKVVLSRAFMVF